MPAIRTAVLLSLSLSLLAQCTAQPGGEERRDSAPVVRGAGVHAAGSRGEAPQTKETQTKETQGLLSSIAVIGASVSCGSGNAKELRVLRDVPLGVFLKSTLTDEQSKRSRFLDLGDTFFFMNPDVNANVQVSKAKAFEPTLIVALDFLFWFAYGEETRKSPRRAEGLERGLRILGRLDGPMVVGDLPDIDHALQGVGPFGGPIVRPAMFPSTEERLAMNQRIAEWAKARGNVRMVHLDGLITKMIRGEPVELRGNAWTVKKLSNALQRDRLHPTVKGSVWTALHVADAIAGLGDSIETRFAWNVERAEKGVLAATEKARDAKRQADERRTAQREAREGRREQEAAK